MIELTKEVPSANNSNTVGGNITAKVDASKCGVVNVCHDYVDPDTTNTKRCKCCGRVLDIHDFRKSSRNPNKREDICADCVRRKQEETRVKRSQHKAAQEQAIAAEEGKRTNPELSKFTARDLIIELRARGYRGKLTYTVVKEVAI